jgi:hypothetical protein
LPGGFVPALGDTFRIMSFAASTGSFASADLPVLPAGLFWDLHYNPSNVSLNVVNVAPLPLTFISARAFKKNKGVEVEWNTAKEKNVDVYKIEESRDGVYFDPAGSVDAIAAGSGTNRYQWFDAAPPTGQDYYRIRAIDLDGKFSYSQIMAVTIAEDERISVYPNPVKRGLNLQLKLNDNRVRKIEIINGVGQVLFVRTGILQGELSIPVPANWTPGQYWLRVVSEGGVATQKIVLL